MHAEDLDCVIEPGITRKAIESCATAGCRSIWAPTLRLGAWRRRAAPHQCGALRHDEGQRPRLKVVLANGEGSIPHAARRRLGGLRPHPADGRIEGTLGIITQLTRGCPARKRSQADLPLHPWKRCNTAPRSSPASRWRIELSMRCTGGAVNLHSKLRLAETPMLP